MKKTITLIGLLIIGIVLLFFVTKEQFYRHKIQEGGYHIVILEGDNVKTHIRVPKGRFIFLISGDGVGYTDTSAHYPVWWTPIFDLRNLGRKHQGIVNKILNR
jgi:hypothetical protein